MLTITSIPRAHCAPADLDDAGKYRFECRTCPYQMLLDRSYYERKIFDAPKGSEDVLGGEAMWQNVDKTESKSFLVLNIYSFHLGCGL